MRMQISLTLLIVAAALLLSCRNREEDPRLLLAESIMEAHPDSALGILGCIDPESLPDEGGKARLALLKSMALDKNYIDTTKFDVLQPAIDYYIDRKKGSPNDRLRSLYYQGRIYQNRNDYSRAMTSFIRATENSMITDSLTLARIHVAISCLLYESYAPLGMMNHSLKAATLYQGVGYADPQEDCYARAMIGSILSGDKHIADSVFSLYEEFAEKNPAYQDDLERTKLQYSIAFGSVDELRHRIEKITEIDDSPEWFRVDIARGYLKLGRPELAQKWIDSINPAGNLSESEQYWLIKSKIYEKNGKYKEALNAFIKFYGIRSDKIFYSAPYDISFIMEQHSNEIQALEATQKKNLIISSFLICMLCLIIVIGLLSYRHKLNKTKMAMMEKENENLALERRNAETERDRQMLLADNRNLQISQMEEEIDTLREILKQKASLSASIESAVKERIIMLNGLIASVISDNSKYANAYEEWKRKMLEDYELFMNSTRLALKMSHPGLISHLENHGLTEAEINYACLYAIGLNGKEVGRYIRCQRHYHISSDIRHKLGLDINTTNLGTYIRKLMEKG